jgi:branched-chain amino acid transport system ATP-binding protein
MGERKHAPSCKASVTAVPIEPLEGVAVPRIAAVDVSVRFGGIVALDGVTVKVPAGQVRGLLGPNGAGKTTLFDVMSGLRPPTTGQILIDGVDVTSTTSMARARAGLHRTFQRQQVFSWLTVQDNVLVAIEWRGGGGGVLGDAVGWPGRRRLERRRRALVEELLVRCHLWEIRHQAVGKLPIAKMRLVEFARALADNPRVLLLDEPTSGLHPSECEQVAQIVRGYREERTATFLIVEHDIEFMLGLCDEITVLEAGRIIFDGSPSGAREDPAVRRAYIG